MWVQQMLENLMSAKFYVGKGNEDDDFGIFVCREDNASDMKRIRKHLSDIRELDIMEAIKYVCECYSDTYDWAVPDGWEELKEKREKGE